MLRELGFRVSAYLVLGFKGINLEVKRDFGIKF